MRPAITVAMTWPASSRSGRVVATAKGSMSSTVGSARRPGAMTPVCSSRNAACSPYVEDTLVRTGVVGVEGQGRAVAAESTPRVRPADPLGTNPRFRPCLVLDSVGPLHGCNEIQLRKAR